MLSKTNALRFMLCYNQNITRLICLSTARMGGLIQVIAFFKNLSYTIFHCKTPKKRF